MLKVNCGDAAAWRLVCVRGTHTKGYAAASPQLTFNIFKF